MHNHLCKKEWYHGCNLATTRQVTLFAIVRAGRDMIGNLFITRAAWSMIFRNLHKEETMETYSI